MISTDKYFVIWYSNGKVKLRGQSGNEETILLNVDEGETYEFGTQNAKDICLGPPEN
jgi:hypothetical protein